MRSYYDRPVLKEPVWKWYVPAYFFTGGVAAGTSLLAAGARLTGDERVARRCLLASLAATGVSTVFLIEDLGRPARLLNMLRVAKVTSPMSVGSWVLAAFGTTTAVAATGRGRLAGAAHAVAAALAPVLATYTAVLIADTAVPAWHEARHELPFVFAGGALASSGSLALLVAPHPAARRLAIAGSVLELAASRRMKSRLGPLAQPYHEGTAGRLAKASEATTAAGALVLALSRWRAPALLVLTGAAAERFAVFHAGVASARDPRYLISSQSGAATGTTGT